MTGYPVKELPLVEMHGAPHQRGLQYGDQARARIRYGIEHYAAQIATYGLGRDELAALATDLLPRITAFDADYVTEMEGIAAGAGTALSDIILLNARTELLQLARQRGRERALPEQDPDGCTGVIVLPEVSRDGTLIHAQNWDWKAECADTAVVLQITGTGGPDILTFAEAGQLARSGMNSAGLSITANYLECERDYREIGVPLALLRRKVLQQAHLAPALRAAYVTRKSASNNIMIAEAGGFGIDIECAPDESFPLFAQNGVLVHANHWQSPVALSKLRDTGIASTPDSLYRDVRVRQILERAGRAITPDTVKEALFDDYQTPFAVCRPPSGTSGNLTATVATIVMQPALGRMEVALLPAVDPRFHSFSIAMAPARTEAEDKHKPHRETTR
jgi:isopenicillin-N N-acyltransferase-like protein